MKLGKETKQLLGMPLKMRELKVIFLRTLTLKASAYISLSNSTDIRILEQEVGLSNHSTSPNLSSESLYLCPVYRCGN